MKRQIATYLSLGMVIASMLGTLEWPQMITFTLGMGILVGSLLGKRDRE